VVGLFPNIPLDVTVSFLNDLLSSTGLSKPIIKEFIDPLELCLKSNNYCEFNNTYYTNTSLEGIGVATSSLLGSLLSKVFMSKFESELQFIGSGM